MAVAEGIKSRSRKPYEMMRVHGQDLSRLWFPSDAPEITPTGQWYVKGSVCFMKPVETATGPDMIGAAMVAGICQDCLNKPIIVLDEFTFRTVRTTMGHEITNDPAFVRDIGLTSKMREATKTFGVRDWFCGDTEEDIYVGNTEIRMDDMMKPKGTYSIIKAQVPTDDMQAISYVMQLQAQRMLQFPLNGVAWRAVSNFAAAWNGSARPVIAPEMQALISLVWGFRMCPYRRRIETV